MDGSPYLIIGYRLSDESQMQVQEGWWALLSTKRSTILGANH